MNKKPETDKLINDAIQGMFTGQKIDLALHGKSGKKGKGAAPRELELALAVILVDLASADQNFDQNEYQAIALGLRRVFGTSKDQMQVLVNQAKVQLAGLRGTGRFAEMLRDNLTEKDKQAVMEVIEDIIAADGKEDGYETYLRTRLQSTLGIKQPT